MIIILIILIAVFIGILFYFLLKTKEKYLNPSFSLNFNDTFLKNEEQNVEDVEDLEGVYTKDTSNSYNRHHYSKIKRRQKN